MALTGFRTTVKLGGTPVTLTSAAMTSYSTIAHTFQVTAATQRILSSTAAVTFKSSSYSLVSADINNINYLFGAVTLTTTFTGSTRYKGPPKATGKYIPVTTIAGGHNYQLNQTATLYDDTDYSSTGWMMRCAGLRDVALTINRFDNIDLTVYNTIAAGTPLLVEIRPGGVGNAVRGWFLAKDENRTGDVNTLETAVVNLEQNAKPSFQQYAWGTP
jgi:hypothetical protein